MSPERRFYWLWGVAAPLLALLLVYAIVRHITESQLMGVAVGALVGVGVWYAGESYYLRREEQRKWRGRGPKDK